MRTFSHIYTGLLGGAVIGTEFWPVSWHGAALGAACGLLVACRHG